MGWAFSGASLQAYNWVATYAKGAINMMTLGTLGTILLGIMVISNLSKNGEVSRGYAGCLIFILIGLLALGGLVFLLVLGPALL